MFSRLTISTLLLFLSLPAWAQPFCNNNFEVPASLEPCISGSGTIDWFDWYTPGNNDPDLLGGLWISPGGDTTQLGPSEPFPINTSTEEGTWEVFFELDEGGGNVPDACTFDIELTILSAPGASFDVVQDGICGSEGIEFDLTPVPGQTYSWSFGDGTSSSQAQPIHVYSLDGGGSQNMTVTLAVTNADGCVSIASQSITVLQNPNPGIGDPAPLCLNNPDWPNYELIAAPTPFGNDGIASWTVDWGNGEQITFPSYSVFSAPITAYGDYGYYTLTIDVVGNNGCTTQVVDSVFVGNNPQIGSANPGNTDGLCSPYLLEFPITNYESNADGTTYNLDFGDGSTESLDHSDLDEVSPTTVDHEYILSSCGSTTPEGSQNAFRFRIEAVNECGTSVTTVDPIRIHLGPDPEISGPDEVCVNQTFNYSISGAGQVVTDAECNPTATYWNIVPLDGQPNVSPDQGVGTSFSTSFPAPGQYQISALDIHPNCPNGDDEMIVCVYPELQAVGQAAPSSGCAPLIVDLEDLSSNPALCGDPNTQWIISGGGYSWVSGGPTDIAPSVQLNTAGTYTITLRVAIPDKDACPPDEQTFTVEVTSPPSVTVGSVPMICAGDELDMIIASLNDGGSPLTSWSWQLDGVEFSTVQGTVPLSFSDPGSYVVTGEAINACGTDTSNINIEVDSIPEIDFELPDLPAYCAGDTMLVIATGALEYTWSSSPVIVGDLHSHCVPIVPQSNVSLGLSANSANGCTNTATIDIEIAPLPDVSIATPPPPCPGETVTFSASASGGSGTYAPLQWSGSAGNGNGNTITWTAPPSASTASVQVTVTDDVGCDNTAQATLTSFNNPVVEAGDSLFLCDNDAVTEPLTGYSPGLNAGGGTGTWSGPGLSGADSFTPAGVGDYDLTFTYTDANGCTESDTRTVVVEAFVQVDPGSPVEACSGAPSFAIPDWSPASATWSGTGVNTNGTVDPSQAPGTYTLTVENGSGSCFSSATNSFTVHPLPLPAISAPTELCEGDAFQATISEGGGAALSWDFDPSAPATIDSVAGNFDIALSGLATTTEGCAAPVSADITVHPLPIVDAPAQDVLCNQAIESTLSGASPAGGLWSGPGVVDGAAGTFLPSSAGTGTTVLTYTFTDGFGCVNTASVDVEVVEPQEAEAGPDLSICDIDTALVLSDFAPASGGVWSGPGVTNPSGTLDAGPLVPGDYTLTYTFGSGTCESEDNRTLVVLPRPVIDLTTSATALCDGETFTFSASVNGGAEPYTFDWTGPVTPGAETATTASATASADATSGSTLTATLKVTDGNGCSETVETTVTVWALPTVDAGADAQFCDQPIPVNLSGFGPAGGTWTGDGITAPDGTFLPSDVGPGDHEAVYSYIDGNGCTNSDTVLVEVIVPQLAVAGPDLSLCDIDTVLTLDGFSPVTASGWTGPGVTDPAGTLDAGPLAPGTYTLTYTIGTGTCESIDTRTLEVRPLPAIALSAADATVCDGSEAAFDAAISGSTAPYDWTWSTNVDGGSGMGNTTAASSTVDLAAGSSLTASLEVVDATGCANAADITIDLLALPTVDAGDDTVFCNTGIAGTLLDFNPGLNELGTGTWSGLGGATGALDPSGNFAPDLSGTGSFTCVYTYTEAATGCVNADTILVDVTDPVNADAGPDTTVCDNAGLLQLDGYFPATNVTWSGSGGGTGALLDGGTGLIDPGALAPGDYTFTLAYGYGTCFTEDDLVVHVDPLPLLSGAGTDTFCGNDGAIALNGPSPAGGTWEGPGADGFGNFQTDAADTGPGFYNLIYWYQSPVTGCIDTLDHTVTVQDIPTVGAGLDTTFCNQPIDGQLLGFSPGLTSGGSGNWYGLGPLAPGLDAGGTVQPDAVGAGSFEAVYSFTAAGTGCTHTDTITVNIAEPLIADAGPDEVACDNDYPLQLTGFFPATEIAWSGTSAGAESGLLDATTGLISPGILAPGSYTYLLEYGVGTCYTSDETVITIDALPVLGISGADAFCNNLGTVTLTPAAPAGGYWDGTGILDAASGTFDSGIPTGDYAPAYIYEDPATGCSDTLDHAVTVHPVPVAAFTADTLGCSNLDLPIQNLSTGATGQTWDLGGVSTSNALQPAFTFPGDGTYTIVLAAENNFGCIDQTSQDVTITHPPTAGLLLTPDSGCAPLDVEFANLSDAPYGTFTWNVNGDQYIQEAPPALNFGQGDSIVDYAVSLTAENLCGSDAVSDAILVYPTPVMLFAFEEDTVCSPFEMNIMNASVGLPDDVTWDFGDGTGFIGADPPDHWYAVDTAAQAFTVTLIGVNQCGADTATGVVLVVPNQVEAFFTLSTPDGCAPFTLTVEDFSSATTEVSYDFDNGDFAPTPIATTTYPDPGTYTVTQFVTNGCSYDTLQLPILVHPVPTATVSVADPSACVGVPFSFAATSDNPGNADWTFGDGNAGAGLSTDHTYAAPGTYTVTFATEAPLTGCSAEATLDVTVHPNPIADIGLDDALGCAPFTTSLVNASSGGVFQSWSFGDGSQAGFTANPTHTFANAGLDPIQYTVTLISESAQLCTDTAQAVITVLPTPVAAFTLVEEESCSYPVDVQTVNASTGSINHLWTFDDTDVLPGIDAAWTANTVGSFPVHLTATNSYACADEAETTFTVHLAPIANITANPRIGCNPLSVDFQDLSTYSLETSLYIEGIYDGPLPTAGLIIDQVGTFESHIVATSPEGCTDTLFLAEDFTVHPVPFANFSFTALSSSPENTSFQFTNESNTSFATTWNFGDGNGSFVEDPLHRYDEPGEYQVSLSVQNEFGCSDLEADLIVIDDKITVFVPNAFTPASNGYGDGINDGFKPIVRGIDLIQRYKFQVFDRWGTVIFQTDDYAEYWKGDVDRGPYDDFDYYAQNEVYNWKVTLTLSGEEADKAESNNPFCTGPRQFCGHVTLVR